MGTALHHRAVYRAANASVVLGLLSVIMFIVFYSTDHQAWLLVAHLLGAGAFGLGVSALLNVPVLCVKERILALAGMVFGLGHAVALGLLLSFAARL